MFDPAVVDQSSTSRRARRERTGARASDRDGPDRAAARSLGAGARDQVIEGDGREGREADGEDISVTIGDFSTTTAAGTFSVAYLVFNTISNLTTQAAQVACFRNVAAHLEPGGCFVIEVEVPGLRLLPPGETIHAFLVSETRWGFDEYDVAVQGLTSHHFEIVDGKVEQFAVPFRYAWPSELDLMAQLAGMKLRERWSGWTREPFTSDSRKHVSVWEKPPS
jgi:hypothetical protein